MIIRLWILLSVLLISHALTAQSLLRQNRDTSGITDTSLVSSFIKDIGSKADRLDRKLDKQSEKALQQMKKRELKMKEKLATLDSNKAKEVFDNAEQQYKDLEQRLQSKLPGSYIPSLDTAITSLKFLQQNPQFLLQTKNAQQKLKDGLSKVNGLEGQFQKAEEIKRFLKERRNYLKKELGNLGFARELKKINKTVFYFNEQIQEYGSLLKDHKKAERKALELLSKSKLFQSFMRKNSMLASLFRLPDPDNPVSQASLAGLQSRAQVNGLIQQIVGSSPNAQQQFQQNVQGAQSQLNELKNKINQFGASSSDEEIPEGFKSNSQRGRNFWKKWELGINFQSNRANGVMPVSSDFGLSAGFKPNNWLTTGIGFATRVGWGKNIRHLSISYSGISVRSFAEIKLKGSFHAVTAYEMNYRPEIRTIEQLKDKSGWQPSLLTGLSKTVSLKTKFFKKTKLQLLWDFLSYQQIPQEQPIKFRIGYNF